MVSIFQSQLHLVPSRSQPTFSIGGDDVEFLGMSVDGRGVKHLDRRKQAIASMSVPKNRKQLQSFLGVCGYFRGHIPNFARKVKPLTALNRDGIASNATFQASWSSDQQVAFDAIIKDILNVEMLTFLDYDEPILIRTDASVDGCGAVMYQIIGGVERPVAYLSKTFSPTERRYSTIEQETYAVFWAITTWSDYLLGQQFTVETDHKNILWLYRSVAPKILRWRLRLQEFDSRFLMCQVAIMSLPMGSVG